MTKWWRFGRGARASISIGDPAAAALFSLGDNFSGVAVNEHGASTLSAIWRALSLLSGSLGMLPLLTEVEDPETQEVKRVASVFDDPGGTDGMTPFEWTRTLVVHLKLHGNVYLLKIRNGAGALVALLPIHPLAVRAYEPSAEDHERGTLPKGGLWFDVSMVDGRETYDATEILHIPGLSLDGKIGMSLVQVARQSLGTAIAGDRAAARVFSNGAMISGIVSPDGDEVDGFDAQGIKRELRKEVGGFDNAGGIAVINRVLKFTPWTMTMQDAQFLQSRQFSIEEIARWTGVPPHLLMQTEKQTSWGTGVEEQNRALSRTVLGPDATLIEQRLSRAIRPAAKRVRYDFTALERPSPDRELELTLQQWEADVITLNEVRKARGLPAIAGGDVTKTRWESASAQPAAA